MTPSMLSPSARAAKVSAMRCLRIGSAIASDVVDRRRQPPVDQRAGARRQHQRLAGARARAPGDQLADLAGLRARARRAHQREDRLDHRFADRQAAHQPLRRDQFVGGHRRLRLALFRAGGVEHDFAFGVAIGIIDVDLHQEAVELRFRQRIGAFLLDRVLRREHMERARHVVAIAGDRHVVLLHRLQQRRLGARARAVDLVGHQELAEDRPRDEAEAALAAGALLQHLAAEDVGRHEIGRELDAAGVEPEHDAHGLDQLGLGEAGKADQQRMPAAQHGDERLLDHRAPGRRSRCRSRPWRRATCAPVASAWRTIISSSFSSSVAGYRHDLNSLSSIHDLRRLRFERLRRAHPI